MKKLSKLAMMLAIFVSMAVTFYGCGESTTPIDPPDPPPSPSIYAPTLGTAEATGVTTTSVEVRGTVSSNGGAAITEQGAILDSDKKTAVTSVTEFSVSYNNLKANTAYKAKVFATNSKGTSYKEVTFKTLETVIIPPVGGKIKDYDGNEYDTVRIGTQTWTVQNLKVMHYNDGTDIPLISDNAAWESQAIGAMCYRSNVVSSKDTYGMLYNFYTTINPKGICPDGWRIPTLDDFIILVKYFGNGDYNAGKKLANGKLKSTSLLWHQPNIGANNSSGFSALPGGARDSDGTFHPYMDYCTGFWSSTQFLPSGLCGRLTISGDVEEVDASNSNYSHPRIGYSIRLIKK